MSLDIGHILKDWPYDQAQVSARRIRGDDGTEKIQLRLDLGLLQMEGTGRPDGKRPHGCESLLVYYEHLRDRCGEDDEFELDEQACERLRNESVMYYHRYLAEFILEDYETVLRDSIRNLRLMDFVARYAAEQSDARVLEQYRPYVLMMRTRAAALLALRENRPKAALAAVREGLQDIEGFHERFGESRRRNGAAELAILRTLAKEIEAHIPVDPIKSVKRKLALAVKEERYEDAIVLRDRLRHLTGDELAGGGV